MITPVSIPSEASFVQIDVAGGEIYDDDDSLAAGHSCALTATGEVYCWGALDYPEAADAFGFPNAVTQPTKVGGIEKAKAIVAGEFSNCALLDTGTVRCWGYNGSGQLGDGTNTDTVDAVDVVGLSDVVSVDVERGHACAVTGDGKVYCWGDNGYGQLGDGTTVSSSSPVAVVGVSGAKTVTTGGFNGDAHSCALLDDGTVRCWGSSELGQLGTSEAATGVVAIEGLSGVVAISAGGGHTCALLDDGKVKCWGYNSHGQLGNGESGVALGGTPEPQLVEGLSGIVAISAGGKHTCAVAMKDDAPVVWCWGHNLFGQLGNGESGFSKDKRTTPVEVVHLDPGE